MTRSALLPPLSAPAESLMREALETDELIKAAIEQVNKLQERKQVIIEELLQHDVREAGNYQLLDKHRTVRKVNVERFSQMYPVEYEKICNQERDRLLRSIGKAVTIKDAERLLGKDDLDPVCDLQSTITWVVVKKENDGTEEVR